jgi:hypothetical protein
MNVRLVMIAIVMTFALVTYLCAWSVRNEAATNVYASDVSSVVPGLMRNALSGTQPENMRVCFICTLLITFVVFIYGTKTLSCYRNKICSKYFLYVLCSLEYRRIDIVYNIWGQFHMSILYSVIWSILYVSGMAPFEKRKYPIFCQFRANTGLRFLAFCCWRSCFCKFPFLKIKQKMKS